jgi:hypothetical protein
MRTSLILVVALAACGGPVGSGGNDDTGDDGLGRVDAESSVGGEDGGMHSVVGDCDIVYTYRWDSGTDESFFEQKAFFAEFDLGSAQKVSARLCNWSSNGSLSNGQPSSGPVCPSGHTCTGSYAPPPTCGIQAGGQIVDGKLRVSCGYEYSTQNGPSGGHWTSVEVSAE